MVGIVGILLLGSLAWSAVGALVSAVGAAGSAFSSATNPPPPATLVPVAAVTPVAVASPVANAPTPTVVPTSVTSATVATATVLTTPTPQVAATPTAATTANARNPWVLLPQPEPGAKIAPGQVTVEARGRGDAPITAMRLELDGAALPTALEQRSESTWRGSASVKIAPGPHNARVTVTDADGRTGSFRWSFTAAPGP
jgi:hypothetical protein